ncbi:MAG: adenine phosphoribosyltransferase [Lentisphaerae bacterium GWF2_45_14]|nr:MAG: adenine phosphoribosyltransferase [Lentisphaerae bacterium GWF2_45_14]
MSIETIKAALRSVPDFPKEGINFIDITPVLQDFAAFSEVVELLAERFSDSSIDYVAGIESRGFMFAAPLALRLGCGFVPIRKAGKLPYKTVSESYDLEYGSATIEMHEDAVSAGANVLLVDDLLATGGTVSAAVRLLEKLHAKIAGIEFVIELDFLKGREKLSAYPVNSLIVLK